MRFFSRAPSTALRAGSLQLPRRPRRSARGKTLCIQGSRSVSPRSGPIFPGWAATSKPKIEAIQEVAWDVEIVGNENHAEEYENDARNQTDSRSDLLQRV